MEVEITWEGNKAVVVLEPISFGDMLDIMKKTTKTKTVNNVIMQERDEVQMSVLMLLKSIKKAPFEPTEENIRKLSVEDGMKLLEASAVVNSFQADNEFGAEKNVRD